MKNITDFTLISRLKRLEGVYNDGQKVLKECHKHWDYYIETETGDCIKLNILAAQIDTTSLILKTLKIEMERLTFELSN